MEKLTIENFLSIEKASIELKKINIFIGPQAQGKSIIAKAINFFKEIPFSLLESMVENETKREYTVKLVEKFEKIFPPEYWSGKTFSMDYSNDHYHVNITNSKHTKKNKINIIFSDEIDKAIKAVRKQIKKSQDIEKSETKALARFTIYDEAVPALNTSLFHGAENPKLEQIIYIPAGRSFFANLQKNIFSFLTTNIKIDYFLTDFGSLYEQTKGNSFLRHFNKAIPPSVLKLVENLICGKFSQDQGEDWITGKSGKINVSNSSSGQQESLPMALMLSTWPYIKYPETYRSFIIEEPEAHLFPVAQGMVVSLIANAYNSSDPHSSYTITTHSPYILTALNNLIQAGNVLSSIEEKKKKDLFAVIPKDEIIYFSDISAYLIDGGTAKGILDYEFKLIDADAIDRISNIFAEKFDKLLNLQYED